MATQSQLDAVTKLHAFGIGDEILTQYPKTGDVPPTSYDIIHQDPYELQAVRKLGGTASHSVTYTVTKGTGVSGSGYEHEFIGDDFGAITPHHFADTFIGSIRTNTTSDSILMQFDNTEEGSIVNLPTINVTIDSVLYVFTEAVVTNNVRTYLYTDSTPQEFIDGLTDGDDFTVIIEMVD